MEFVSHSDRPRNFHTFSKSPGQTLQAQQKNCENQGVFEYFSVWLANFCVYKNKKTKQMLIQTFFKAGMQKSLILTVNMGYGKRGKRSVNDIYFFNLMLYGTGTKFWIKIKKFFFFFQ